MNDGIPPVKKSGGGGLGAFLFILALLAAGSFGFAMYYLDESPQQLCQRLAGLVEDLTKLSPVPRLAQAPSPTPSLETATSPAPRLATPTPFNQHPQLTAVPPQLGEPAPQAPQPLPIGIGNNLAATAPTRHAFTHPGLLHTNADFERMRTKVEAGQSPWIDGWKLLSSSRNAQLGWRPRPLATVVRGGSGQNFPVLFNDIHAAYQLGLRWKISGDEAYAKKSVEILNGWSSTLKEVVGNSDRFLASGIYGYQFANAAEIMRTYSGWSRQDLVRFQQMMLKVFYPMNQQFLRAHNDAAITNYWANWDLCNIASMQAIGVLCDRADIYQEAMAYFETGAGNGALNKAVCYLHDGYLGQWQESGRDQGHTTLGIALMGPIMETAWNQGEDWYGRDNNRFLAGAEYVAKYNLGHDVPFQLYAHGKGQKGALEVQPGISGAGRPSYRAGYELVLNHYLNRRGIAAPFCQQYAAKIRPEGGGGGHPASFDQLGFGTLTATRDLEVPNPKPSGLTIQKREGKAVLSWWGAAGATSYSVKRAPSLAGPYTTLANEVKDLLTYTDQPAQSGTYFYVVTGMRDGKETAASNPAQFSVAPTLRVHLKFDESSGATPLNAVNRSTPATLPNKASWSAGRIGNAVSLNGKNQFVALPAGIARDLSDFTIAAWVYLDAATPWARIFDFGDNRGQWMFLTLNRGNGMPRFEVSTVYGYNAQRTDGTVAVPAKKWVHVAVTLSGRKATIYLDGTPIGTNSEVDFPPFRLGNTPANWIGRSQFERDPYLDGKVDDFRLYDGALTPEAIAALAN